MSLVLKDFIQTKKILKARYLRDQNLTNSIFLITGRISLSSVQLQSTRTESVREYQQKGPEFL